MKLFHGSWDTTAPVIKVGALALGDGDNVFDGLFASTYASVAKAHGDGETVHAYEVDDEKIADNAALNERIEEIIKFLGSEVYACDVDDETIKALAYALADGEETDEFDEIFYPRSCVIRRGACSWEMQRLRGRAAAYLGFDAVEMDDEHGTSYLIVNPEIKAV
ncbi:MULTISPECIES: hypothetical protein [Yersinia]|uniref:hypothetical protein n=1 Tax=Yersinia TaxID=629 RepID=UPI00119E0FEC|nr:MULTISPECIES: hypothetical protein [Yersinia]